MGPSLWVSLVALSLLGLPAYHAAIIGRAISIYDGDTFKVNETATGMVFRIRMHGIDAPELSQLCVGADGADYPCGKVTQQALVNLIGSAPVKCEVQTTDKYNRSVSLCWGNEGAVDLGQQLVSSGLAFAYRQYSDLYVPAEESAKAAKLGMWAGSFMFPWDWRRQQSSNDTNTSTPPDPDCAIKGNIGSDKQKIYHVPGSRFYNTTSIDESAGERWFCSAYEAEIAGWRPSGCAVKGDIASNGDRVYFISSSPDYSSVVVDVTAGERWFCSSAEAEIAGWRPAGCPIKGDIASNGEKVYFTASAQGYSSITINVTAGERWFCSSSDAEVAGWRPAGCPIKGDITASGDKVYHAPNGTEYNTVSVNVTAGERWFCSSTEAEVAGWRPAGCAIKGDMALNGERIYYTPTPAGYSTVSVNVTAGEHWFCTAWDAEVASWRPVGCPIKGNINSAKEKIYHVPGGRYYSSTVIDVTQGEKWFCTESQAVAAGWRKSSARRHRLMRRMLMA